MALYIREKRELEDVYVCGRECSEQKRVAILKKHAEAKVIPYICTPYGKSGMSTE